MIEKRIPMEEEIILTGSEPSVEKIKIAELINGAECQGPYPS